VVDAVAFQGQENGRSLGRYPDGGPWWSTALQSSNAANSTPRLGPVVSELMFHPPDGGGTNDNTRDEYIELINPTANPIPLFDTNGAWRLAGGVRFTFPADTTLRPGAALVGADRFPQCLRPHRRNRADLGTARRQAEQPQ
jgi:hypothetical protein